MFIGLFHWLTPLQLAQANRPVGGARVLRSRAGPERIQPKVMSSCVSTRARNWPQRVNGHRSAKPESVREYEVDLLAGDIVKVIEHYKRSKAIVRGALVLEEKREKRRSS